MVLLKEHTRQLLKPVIERLRLFNVYVETHTDTAEDRRNQIWSTRLYICLFAISMMVILPYAALTNQTTTVRVEDISLNKFQELEAKHSDSLLCSCSKIAASPATFVNMNIELHQV